MSGGLGNLGGSLTGGIGGITGGLGDGLANSKNEMQKGINDAIGKSKETLGNAMKGLKEAPDKLLQKGKEKFNDLSKKLGNTNLLDIKNSIMKLFGNAKSLFEKPKTEKEKSIDYIKKLLDMFKDLDDCSKELMKMYLTKYTLELSKNLLSKDPEKYEEETKKINEFLEEEAKKQKEKKAKKLIDENLIYATELFHKRKKYFVFQFEEFILVLLRFLRFVVGIQAKLEFFENQDVFIYLFLHKNALPILAESMNYELQVKPYGDQFQLFMKKKYEKPNNKKLLFKEEEELLVKMLKKNETFDELDHSNQLKFPPYFPYEMSRTSKFRKYWNDDEYHLCYKDIEFRTYNDIFKNNNFIDVDIHDHSSQEEADEFDGEEEEKLTKEQKINKKVEEFLEFKYIDDEDKLCKIILKLKYSIKYLKIQNSGKFSN